MSILQFHCSPRRGSPSDVDVHESNSTVHDGEYRNDASSRNFRNTHLSSKKGNQRVIMGQFEENQAKHLAQKET
jgi:hypothetical protein